MTKILLAVLTVVAAAGPALGAWFTNSGSRTLRTIAHHQDVIDRLEPGSTRRKVLELAQTNVIHRHLYRTTGTHLRREAVLLGVPVLLLCVLVSIIAVQVAGFIADGEGEPVLRAGAAVLVLCCVLAVGYLASALAKVARVLFAIPNTMNALEAEVERQVAKSQEPDSPSREPADD